MNVQNKIGFPNVRINRRKESGTLKGPLRVFRLCLLSILLPGLLIAGPLYLRYRVFSEQVYPLGMSDMRLVDSKMSTTWCQKQLVKSNGTFSAYLLPDEPQIKVKPVQVSMVRYLNLEDDMKEYWGFYLLKGSSVTVSTCCRWPGASLIVIKGHSHLRDCAYIGDNSSEELEELEELDRQKAEAARKEEQKGKANGRTEVWPLKKARPNIQFYGSNDSETSSSSGETSASSVGEEFNASETEVASEKLRTNISHSVEPVKTEPHSNEYKTSNHNMADKNSDEIFEDIISQIASLGNRSASIMSKLRTIFKIGTKQTDQRDGVISSSNSSRSVENVDTSILTKKRRKRSITLWGLEKELNKEDEHSDAAREEGLTSREEIRGTINGTTANDMSNSEFWSSFSSSEERLLSCAGLILNLPLTPSKRCHPSKSDSIQAKASLTNKLTYEIPSDGYYFFVFSSENEIQPNYIRIHFNLQKILYNVSNPVASCTNTTDSCSLPLNFFSREKVVLEMPVNANETLWNQEYVVVSMCEPRTIVYAACVIAVPILILLFAF